MNLSFLNDLKIQGANIGEGAKAPQWVKGKH